MICKICNAQIDDNASVCPFCGTMTTVDVDPNNAAPTEMPDASASSFPDPASPAFNAPQDAPAFGNDAAAPVTPAEDVPAEPAAPEIPDVPLSDPAPAYTDPMAQPSQPQPSADPYMNGAGEIPNGQPVQPNYGNPNNNYNNPNPNNFNQAATPPPMGGGYGNIPDPTSDLEKQAGTVQTLGIVALIVAIVVGFCCCALAGPGVGIAGLIKYNKIKDSLYLISPEGQKKANTGKLLSIIAIVLGALGIVVNIILMATGALEGITDEL